MVIPNFVDRAKRGETLFVHGEGNQSRCFCHVADVVRGLVGLMQCDEARGQVVNLGSEEEITIAKLAEKVISELKSSASVEHLSYEAVYGEGFEDMQRRVPSIEKAKRMIGWQPEHSLTKILADVASMTD